MANRTETFRKHEKLCSKKAIETLFEKGTSFTSGLFQVIWTINNDTETISPARIAISVSKKSFKSAVKRNSLKRRIREAYRRKKYILYDFLTSQNISIMFIIIYKETCMFNYHEIEKAIEKTLLKLTSSIRSKKEIHKN
ncbi:MAG: ribonuclease P protein component [Bacteroidales bacterium]